MTSKMFLIAIFDQIDETQRRLIGASVKEHARGWWHHVPDVWIFGTTETVSVWRDRLGVFITGGSTVFVLTLPKENERAWSARGSKAKFNWLQTSYAAPSGKPPTRPAGIEKN